MFNDNMIEKSNKILQPNIQQKNLQTTTFAAGCFLGVEEAFSQQKGVKSTMVGYTGRSFEQPTYRDVCSHKTDHAEAVQVEFDPNDVSYDDLVEVFWLIHNPTTKNRQGWDTDSQYRSLIAYHTFGVIYGSK
jgi:peptide-methionine (S)-S-oxide reductase